MAAQRPPVTDAVLRTFAKGYVKGMSIRALASVHGLSYGATHRRLIMAQEKGLLSMRTRGAKTVPGTDRASSSAQR